MKRSIRLLAVAALLSGSVAADVHAAELRGSRASMIHQHGVAKSEGYTFLRTPEQVQRYVAMGLLEWVPGNGDYELAKVSFPYARPEVRRFLEDLGADYRAWTGRPLVVTSLTRPASGQPGNASALSVHPAGMAMDLRVPKSLAARRWLEERLLELEVAGVLDVTRERRPPHYHVAVFPSAYDAWAGRSKAAVVLTAAVYGTSLSDDAPVMAEPVVAGPAATTSWGLATLVALTSFVLLLAGRVYVAPERRRLAALTVRVTRARARQSSSAGSPPTLP